MSQTIFTPQQIIALDAIAGGATITDAAAQAGVHRNTISNWRRETTNFQLALANAQYDRALVFRERAEALADLAFDTLRTLLSDAAASPSVRCRAAQYILNLITTQMAPQQKVELTVADYIDAAQPKLPNSAQSGSGLRVAQSFSPANNIISAASLDDHSDDTANHTKNPPRRT